MKELTTEIPDSMYRSIRKRSSIYGQTVREFMFEALREKLAASGEAPPKNSGWRAVFGRANHADVSEVQRIIDEEFSRVNVDR
jgi:hypothetical protein